MVDSENDRCPKVPSTRKTFAGTTSEHPALIGVIDRSFGASEHRRAHTGRVPDGRARGREGDQLRERGGQVCGQ